MPFQLYDDFALVLHKHYMKSTIKMRMLFASKTFSGNSYPGFLVTSTVIRELQQSKKAKTYQTADYLPRW